ncbi:MAG: glucose-6-phosphate isomerase [Gammaproteobacteria bacterium]|nr:glucose-6-phosphate isomerase [Gammaproteobacteria bacterium]MYG65185.1 glucose-6-phosphate isomerase [Gammaproteobacteria bacterium]
MTDALPMTTRLDRMPEWQSLNAHARAVADRRIGVMFRDDPGRFGRFSGEAAGIFLDYSKHNIDSATLELLLALARASDVEGWRERQFRGKRINVAEDRAALHTALRSDGDGGRVHAPGPVREEVAEVLGRIGTLAEAIRSGQWRGHTGKPVRTVVNIGIGGSHLGPALVCRALSRHDRDGPEIRFLSNVDSGHFDEITRDLDPEATLFVLASKTFSTQETLANAESARQWLGLRPGRDPGAENHFIAVTGHHERALAFGIVPENIYPLPDWVGGRFSLWSAIGISIAIGIGMEGFRALLRGARAMDEHFLAAPLERNLPVLMAMTGIWCRNFLGTSSLAVVPYTQGLELLPAFLQQMEMESNGKRVTRKGEEVAWETCPVIWGAVGTNGQHTFFQHLHQGVETIPVDFIVVKEGADGQDGTQRKLVANAVAQSAALMAGRDEEIVRQHLSGAGLTVDQIDRQAPHRTYPGNRPSSTIVLERLTPESLGALIALYEHKVFVQGVVWQVCSFDQWGVELGKELAVAVDRLFTGDAAGPEIDGSTRGLVALLGSGVETAS